MRKVTLNTQIIGCLIACLTAFTGLASSTFAAVEAKIDMPAIRCIQTNTAGEGKTDNVYFVVNGVVKGKAANWQVPKGKTLKASPKVMPADPKNPITLWDGKLEDGEFVVLTVAMFQGTQGKTAEGYLKAKTASDKKVDALGKAKLTGDEFKAARKALNAQNQVFVTGYSKESAGKGDAFVGLFDVMVGNAGGKLVKACTPVGLTSGDHYGTEAKRYTKIKYTRENVLVKDANNQWFEMQMAPVSDNEDIVRIKMLETVKKGDAKNVTDYLIDVRVTDGGKATTWLLPPKGEHPGPTIIHDYWDYAE